MNLRHTLTFKTKSTKIQKNNILYKQLLEVIYTKKTNRETQKHSLSVLYNK